MYRGRVGTACQPSAPWGLTSFGILNVSDPVGSLCLSRAPPAGRGATASRPFAAQRPSPCHPSVLRNPYSVLWPLPFHFCTGLRPICTFARLAQLLRPRLSPRLCLRLFPDSAPDPFHDSPPTLPRPFPRLFLRLSPRLSAPDSSHDSSPTPPSTPPSTLSSTLPSIPRSTSLRASGSRQHSSTRYSVG